eukprot:2838697-Prymnesium_polylepis.1
MPCVASSAISDGLIWGTNTRARPPTMAAARASQSCALYPEPPTDWVSHFYRFGRWPMLSPKAVS